MCLGAALAQGALPPALTIEPVLSGLSSPVLLTNAHDGSNRRFVVEQPGRILVLRPDATTPTIFLDIRSKVLAGGEQGLLGLAFHPQFSANGRFFVDYTRRPDGATVIAEYHVSAAPDSALLDEKVLLVIPQPFANHNGGMIEFGPDGFLYVAMGDGGSANDPENRAQNIEELLGKILRIDVDQPNGATPYSAPADNPFFGPAPGRDEIYALGLRNPFRFSFDRATGQLYVGDVGQSTREEIDVVTRGGNYGWRVFEGTRCTGLGPAACDPSQFQAPIAEYDHSVGRCSITGGYVYRGTRSTLPAGAYVYGDFCTGEIFMLAGGMQSLLLNTNLSISSFGEDEAGELYVVNLGGTVHRLASACSYSITPTSQGAAAGGGNVTVTVTATAGCAWTAVSNSGFITVTAGASGSGNGTVTLAVAGNGTGVPRTGTVTIAGQTFTVTQPELIPVVTTLQFSAATYQVGEGDGRVTVTVTRTGDTSSAASVDYQTADTDTLTVGCADTANNHGAAYARCDFSTTVGTLVFAAGETQKTFTVPIIDDAHVEGTETFQLRLSNATGAIPSMPNPATVSVVDNDANPVVPNPIFTSEFFVRQHYLDFLSREPEPSGLQAWLNVLNNCPDVNNLDPNSPSALCDRIRVSQSFFGSQEFQLKGFYVFRFYKLAFGRLPEHLEIVSDMSFVAGATPQEVFQRKAQLATNFTQRPEFQAAYGGLPNADYVHALMARAGLTQITTPDPANPDGDVKVTLTSVDLVSKLNSNMLTRAQVLRAIADSDQVGAAEFNNAFVAMQYYGYLRRKPEPSGYEAWLRVLQGGDIRTMVNGFMNSQEYRLRFGPLQ